MNPLLSLLFLLASTSPASAQVNPLQRAEITTIINDVRIAKSPTSPKPASIGEPVLPNDAVLTGPKSRAELVFSDQTLARLGANTQFTFIPGTRTTEINQGTVLLQVPKGAGGAQVKTAAVTAAVTGTTIMVEYFPNNFIKLIVLEGTLRVSLTTRLGESILLEAGQMLILDPKATRLPDPVHVDLKKLVKTSKLIAGMGGPGELDFRLINQEINDQERQKRRGQLLDTNILIAGSGTELILVDESILRAIQEAVNANTFLSLNPNTPSGPIPPPSSFSTITSPNPFPLGPSSIVSTNPTITNGSEVFQGASRTATGNADDTAFLFGTSNPASDVFLGGYLLDPGTPFAAFRFAGLALLGTPIILTPTGVTNLGLVSESTVTFAPGTYTFSPLTSLFFGSVSSMTVPHSAAFLNPSLDLTFYARGPGSNLVFDGDATTRTLALLATGNLIYGANATFSGLGLEIYSLSDILIQSGASASQFITVVSNGAITFHPDMMGALIAPTIFLEHGDTVNPLILSPEYVLASNSLEARASRIFVANLFPFSLYLFAGSGGIEVAQPDGFVPLFNLNVVEITGGGNLIAGNISFNQIGLANISGNVQIESFLRGNVPVTMTVGGSMSATYLDFNGFHPVDAPHGGSLTLNIPHALFGAGGVGTFEFKGASGVTAGGQGGVFHVNAQTITFNGETSHSLSGGEADPGGVGGAGGSLHLFATSSILFNGETVIVASGGGDTMGIVAGGPGGALRLTTVTGQITGPATVALDVSGKPGTSLGGYAGSVVLQNQGAGGVLLSGLQIDASGGDGADWGGQGGSVEIQSAQGPLFLEGATITAKGGAAYSENGVSGSGGNITLTASGLLTFSLGSMTVDGGTFNDSANGVASHGGDILLKATDVSSGRIEVSQATISASGGVNIGPGLQGQGGSITLQSLRQAGSGITVNNSSHLKALAQYAAASGGFVRLETAGANIAVLESTLEASGGVDEPSQILAYIPESASGGTTFLDNATLHADILRVGALSPNGAVTISNGSILSASTILRIYGGTSNGIVRFTGGGTIVLTGGAVADIRAHTVQIDSGTTVDNDGLSSTNVDATNHLYNISGYGNFTTLPTSGPAPGFFDGPGPIN